MGRKLGDASQGTLCLKRKKPFELSSVQLTEIGYTQVFESEVRRAANEESVFVNAKNSKKMETIYRGRSALVTILGRAAGFPENNNTPRFVCPLLKTPIISIVVVIVKGHGGIKC